MTLVETCDGCNRRRAVELIGFGRAEFPLCADCRRIYQEVDSDLIELWARTGIRQSQVLETKIVRAFKAAGIECRYQEGTDNRILPEYQAARAALEVFAASAP